MKRKKLRFYVCFFLYQTAILIQLYIHFHFPEDSYGGALHLLIFIAVTVVVFTYFPLVKEIHQTTKLEAELTILERQQFLRQRQSQALCSVKKRLWTSDADCLPVKTGSVLPERKRLRTGCPWLQRSVKEFSEDTLSALLL